MQPSKDRKIQPSMMKVLTCVGLLNIIAIKQA